MGREDIHFLKSSASVGALIVWALTSTFAVVIWGVTLKVEGDARFRALETGQAIQDKRLDQMDSEGTRRLQLVEERQREVIKRIETIGEHMNIIDRQLATLQETIARMQRDANGKPTAK